MKRDTKNKIVAGVCSGMAKHLGIDPVFIRLAFLMAFFFLGAGPLIYLILWIIIQPE